MLERRVMINRLLDLCKNEEKRKIVNIYLFVFLDIIIFWNLLIFRFLNNILE
jgi:hypothetical protein